jgi:tRNA pseudouridine55 synthase
MHANHCDGLLVLDKPASITSRLAVDRALRWFPRRTRIGHTGTLDPLATGVLVLCLGSATRLAEYVQRMSKTYRSTLRLGGRSDTNDADGQISLTPPSHPPERGLIEQALAGFVGVLEQVPPAFSAARVTGQRAYDLARRGQALDLRPRSVTVYGIDLLRYAFPDLEVEVRCGKGTYIRSLARDLGENLGCGAWVQALRRTRVGSFSVEEACSLDLAAEEARARILPVERALEELPRIDLDAVQAERFLRGQAVEHLVGEGERGEVGVFTRANGLLGVGALDRNQQTLRPVKVLRGGASRSRS